MESNDVRSNTLTIAGRSGAGRGTGGHGEGPRAMIAEVPSGEQDRLLREYGEAVADHMANHFAQRAPHLAAKSGFTRWQRAAGVAAALGVIALGVVAPAVLSITMIAVITVITFAHLVIALAARRRRRGGPDTSRRWPTPTCPATRSWSPHTRSRR